jgi:signal transduction histidine kinase
VVEDCASGDPQRMQWADVPITRKGDETTFITARNIPVPERQLMISTVWDVTERKSLEGQLLKAQKMEAVGRLAGGVAHDYNNMLGVNIGYAELAPDRVNPSEPLHADLKEILKAARRSTDITR